MQRKLLDQITLLEEMMVDLLKKSLGVNAGVLENIVITAPHLTEKQFEGLIRQTNGNYKNNKGVLLAVSEYCEFRKLIQSFLKTDENLSRELDKCNQYKDKADVYNKKINNLYKIINEKLKDKKFVTLPPVSMDENSTYDEIIDKYARDLVEDVDNTFTRMENDLPPKPTRSDISSCSIPDFETFQLHTLLTNRHEESPYASFAIPVCALLEALTTELKHKNNEVLQEIHESAGIIKSTDASANLVKNIKLEIDRRKSELKVYAQTKVNEYIAALSDEIMHANGLKIDDRLRDKFKIELQVELRKNNILKNDDSAKQKYNEIRSRYEGLGRVLQACDEYDAHLKKQNNNVDIELDMSGVLPTDPAQPVTLKDKAMANRNIKIAILSAPDSTIATANLKAKVDDDNTKRVLEANRDSMGTRLLKSILLVCTFGLSARKVGLWKSHGAAHSEKLAGLVNKKSEPKRSR